MSYFYQVHSYVFKASFIQILKLAIPLIFTQSLQMLLGLVDTFVAGQLGTQALASMAVANGLFWGVIFIGLGFFSGIDTFVARAVGAKDVKASKALLIQGIWLAVFLSIGSLCLISLAGFAYKFLELDTNLISNIWSYLIFLMPGIPSLFLGFLFQSYWKAHGIVKPWIWLMLALNILNIFCDYAFVYGWFGSNLGVDGIALSTSVCRGINLFVILIYTIRAFRIEKLWAFSLHSLKPNQTILKQLIAFGLPTFGFAAVDIIAFQLLTLCAATFGELSLAVHQLMFVFTCLTLLIAQGWSQAQAILFGHLFGAKAFDKAFAQAHFHIGVGALFVVIFSLALWIWPNIWLQLMTKDAILFQAAKPLMSILCLVALFDMLQILFSSLVTAAGETRRLFWAGVIGHYGIGIPLASYLAYGLQLGVLGLWLGMTGALLVILFCNIRAWRIETNKLRC